MILQGCVRLGCGFENSRDAYPALSSSWKACENPEKQSAIDTQRPIAEKHATTWMSRMNSDAGATIDQERGDGCAYAIAS